MPYSTGLANSASDLLNAVVAAATEHGWRWDADNGVLQKGAIVGELSTNGLNLLLRAALGYSDAAPDTPAPKWVGITDRLQRSGNTPLSYPLTYHLFVHTQPDDIILAVNYQVVWWQWLALGQARTFGVLGNGVWQWGTATSDINTNAGVAIDANGSTGSGSGHTSGAPFWQANDVSGVLASSIYLDFNRHGWWNNPNGNTPVNPNNARATIAVSTQLVTQPNTWNGEAVLIRVHIMAQQPSSFWSHVAELPHLRMLRNDNINNGQILNLGSERWFVAPVYRKNTQNRNSSEYNHPNHSGTVAMAVRYDGP
ncbi:hypothetical protein AB833_17375 [Chromatiales bacterium (ex Bugula neritina AB1)]|nr:hypothetical protein AB833_17375 [Chromatiales bacterium (ex Bugula neritina AB1)]